jgi:hypothetical protein
MTAQPNEVTCGPTCLHAIYRYWKDDISLKQVIEEIDSLEEGGTLAVVLARHALRRGYRARIYTYNLQVFDPTWFLPKPLSRIALASKLEEQAAFKESKKLHFATKNYLDFLKLGGEVRFQDLSRNLIRKYLKRGTPILSGLSSTFLYHSCREYGKELIADDIRGKPEGHFVLLNGYDTLHNQVTVTDPFQKNPYSPNLTYTVSADRVLSSILLGVLTYDANLLILEK